MTLGDEALGRDDVEGAEGRPSTTHRSGGVAPAPSGPQLGPRLSGGKRRGPNPFVVVGLAAAAGALIAKLVDWRGHAHPRA
jgi:hypothetical protein